MSDAFARNPNTQAASSAWEKHVGVTETMTSDDPIGPSPYTTSDRESRIAYRVKRSANTQINGYPDAILYNGKTKLVTVNAGKPEDARWLEIIEASLYKRVTGMGQDEEMELYPRIKLTISTELGKPPRIIAMTPQGMSDADRDHDRRRRDIFAAEKLAAELHVGNVTHIIRKHIITPLVPDLKAATDEIRALHGAEGHNFDPAAYDDARDNDYWCDPADENIYEVGMSVFSDQAEDEALREDIADDIDGYFPRDEHNQPTVEDSPARNYGNLWRRLNNTYANILTGEDQHDPIRHKRIHNLLGVKNSLKELPEDLTDDQIVERFAAAAISTKKESAVTAAETTVKRPTTGQIDAARKTIAGLFKNAGITDQEAYRKATGDETLPASLEAGKGLDQIIVAVNRWIEAQKAEKEPSEPAGASQSEQDDTPPASENGHGAGDAPRSEPANVASTLAPQISIVTLTGVNALDIPARLNRHLPPEAYGAIKFGQMSGKTDVDGDYVRDRFDEVFGPMGIGWRIKPDEHVGRVDYRSEQRTSSKGNEQEWHVVTLIAHTFEYSLIVNGSLTWVLASTTSDQHDNTDYQYAYRGAMTSLMKQFYKLMGGMNHVTREEYNHNHAAKDLAKQGKRAA